MELDDSAFGRAVLNSVVATRLSQELKLLKASPVPYVESAKVTHLRDVVVGVRVHGRWILCMQPEAPSIPPGSIDCDLRYCLGNKTCTVCSGLAFVQFLMEKSPSPPGAKRPWVWCVSSAPWIICAQ